MTALQKYNAVFETALDLPPEKVPESSQKTTETWDSVAQIAIVGGLANAFGVTLTPEDILDMSSYRKGKDILGRHGVIFT